MPARSPLIERSPIGEAVPLRPDGLRLLGPDDAAWSRFFSRLPAEQQDLFYAPAYAQLCARWLYPQARVRAAVLETASSVLLYPFVQRRIGAVVGDEDVAGDAQDIVGLYGRGGLGGGGAGREEIAAFHRAFGTTCREQRIICGFDRYHPVLGNYRWAAAQTQLQDVGGFVVCDLRLPLAELERADDHAVRKNIKKAQRAGGRIISEDSTAHLEEFVTIYSATLARRRASRFYAFDRGFYDDLARRLPGQCRFFYAQLGSATVSCELVLYHGRYAHSFLGGTLEPYMDACPNHLLKREIIREMKARGCWFYLLGGGPVAYDGIWKYKRGFAVAGSVPSLVGGTIFDAPAYESVRQAMQQGGLAIHAAGFQFFHNR